ncbi:MAG: TVP38/TMEM64 family protein [Clostridiales bacterium]|nr:TVP38/TMEM64 family protein [Clostridiales bacterium]MCD8214325.1 TVP38/TMEM64 family protein [Clostridiales bacterium]
MNGVMKKVMEWLCLHKRSICIISCILTAALIIYWYRLGIFTDEEKMNDMLTSLGIAAPLAFVFIQAVQVVIPILPGAVGCVFGVVFFGPLMGFIYNYIGICIGSVLAFLIARSCGREFVRVVTGGKFFQKYSKYLLKENQFEKIFALLIFLPVAPDDFLCYLAGISKISVRKFVLIILLGKPAAIFLYSMGFYKILEFSVFNFA